jgi:hypothetical protein
LKRWDFSTVQISAATDDYDMLFRSINSGGTGFVTRLTIDGQNGNVFLTGDLYSLDNERHFFGTGSDFSIFHDGTDNWITTSNGKTFIRNTSGSIELITGASPVTRLTLDQDGRIGIGIIPSTAFLRIAAGSSAQAPLMFATGGSLMSTPAAGAMEFTSAGLFFTPSGIRTRLAMSFSATITGNGVASSFPISHPLNTTDVNVTVWEVSTDDRVFANEHRDNSGQITVSFGAVVPDQKQYRVVIQG